MKNSDAAPVGWWEAREAERWQTHLKRAGGLWMVLGALFVFLATGVALNGNTGTSPGMFGAVSFAAAFGILMFAVGVGFWRGQRWPRWVLWPLSVLVLVGLLDGFSGDEVLPALLCGYTVYVLLHTRTRPSGVSNQLNNEGGG